MLSPTDHCIIVGAGHAAAQLCASLRQHGWAGRLTLIGDEPVLPYHRPPLSKTYFKPEDETGDRPKLQWIRPADFYASNHIDRKLGEPVRSIDRDAKTIRVGNETLSYDTLVLATGSLHRRPPIDGIDHPRVLSLRTAQDADAIRESLPGAQHAAVIGAGFIGLEVAAALRKLGLGVTVFEMADRVLARVTGEATSDYYQDLHRGHGVDLRTNASVSAIQENDGQLSLISGDGVACEADFVIVGAGAQPNQALALDAGLDCDNGILVDEHNRSTDPSIFSIGDCCNQYHPMYETRLRIESIQNATDQGKAVAAVLAGKPAPKTGLPWFWSDQYDVKLQIAGLSTGYDRCIPRGEPRPGSTYSLWYFKGDRLIAVDAMNDPRSYVIASKLIPKGAEPDPGVIADPDQDLKPLLTSSKSAAP
ncbi:MAG: FAD-dependent oxidoreductase [Planctomycetota bacterium]